ncbi:MAG: hypothetical protein WC346_00330 [Methanogenium sp.]|jgi:hypothetical protein
MEETKLSEELWLEISEKHYPQFIELKTEAKCGDVKRELDECFVEWLEEQLGLTFSDEERQVLTEMVIFWYENELIGD